MWNVPARTLCLVHNWHNRYCRFQYEGVGHCYIGELSGTGHNVPGVRIVLRTEADTYCTGVGLLFEIKWGRGVLVESFSD
jgi:hypothetical protein